MDSKGDQVAIGDRQPFVAAYADPVFQIREGHDFRTERPVPRKAVAQELDPQLAETHLARFQLLYSQFEGYQGDAAAHEVLLAHQLNPNVGHAELAYMYIHLGLEDLASRALARAYEIDPTSDSLRETTLLTYEVEGRYDDYAADRSVRHDGRIEVLYLIAKGRLDDAQKAVDRWSQADQTTLPPTDALLLAAKGNFSAAEAEIPLILAKWLRESAVSGYHLYPRYTRDPFLKRIQQSPEFIQFLAEMKAENDRYRHEFS